MAHEIDFEPYSAHFEKLKKGKSKITVFGKPYSLDELHRKATEIAVPKHPVNDKKLPQKKGFFLVICFWVQGKASTFGENL